MSDLKSRLSLAAVRYDRKHRRGHAASGLAIILFRIDEVCAEVEAGADPRVALAGGFNDRLLDCLLAAV